MPSTFESFGIKFMYPDNWTLAERAEEEGHHGVTLEMPGGGFLSVEQDLTGFADEQIVRQISDTFDKEYEGSEREPVALRGAREDEIAFDFRFYYLDLLIISRLVLLTVDDLKLVIQIQAESRDFEKNELVFDAILTQIRQ